MPFVNLYRSGWFHHAGKPNTFDAHPGDLYATEEAAKADISTEARELYLGTYAVLIDGFVERHPHDGVEYVKLNGPDSVPQSLAHTRAEFRTARQSIPRTPVLNAEEDGLGVSLDTSDHEAVHIEPPAVVAYRAAVKAADYKPAHGDYPS